MKTISVLILLSFIKKNEEASTYISKSSLQSFNYEVKNQLYKSYQGHNCKCVHENIQRDVLREDANNYIFATVLVIYACCKHTM